MEPLSKHIEKFIALKNTKNFILIRHGQSMANMSGSICGWTDVRLSYKGFFSFFAIIKLKYFYFRKRTSTSLISAFS